MNDTFQSSEVHQIPIHICSTNKYKTNSIAVYIRQPLALETASMVALIPEVLMRGSEKYPNAGLLRRALDDLYGANLFTDVMKRGEEQIMIIRLQIANEKFLTDQTPLLEKGIELLSDVLLRPVKENGVFSKKYVELEKDLLLRKLAQLKDDKIRYANKRIVEKMFEEERYGLYEYGDEEQLKKIQPEGLYEYYERMLRTSPFEWFVVGDVEQGKVQELVAKHFTLQQQEIAPIPQTEIRSNVEQEREVVEKTKISQGKLHIGCRTGTVYSDQDFIALQVCNGVFGGFSHSKLFRNVREKESLAYYVYSSLESHKGIMMIMAGIEFKNYEKTVSIIKDQLQQVKDGQISEEEIEQTKAILINQIKQSNDQPFQMMDRFMQGVIAGYSRSSEELIAEIERITKKEIEEAAQKIQVDTIYFLTSDEEASQ